MFHLINEGHLSPVTLKLDSASHFFTGIATADIANRSSDQARRWGRANTLNESFCLLRKTLLEAPDLKRFITQHAYCFLFFVCFSVCTNYTRKSVISSISWRFCIR